MKCIDTATIFPSVKDTSKGKIKVYNTTIGHKDENGNYVNASLEVRFTKTEFPKEKLDKELEVGKAYVMDLLDAWLDTRAYEVEGKQHRAFVLVIKACKLKETKEVSKTTSTDSLF